jgi:tight adherence protein C
MRVDAPIVQSVVTTLVQTLRYGTPFAQAIRNMAAQMRNDALVRLEERANALPALLTIPMILFLLPTIILIVGGPAALKLMDSLPN